MAFRIIPGILGVFFLTQGLGWLADPAGAAEGLGMPLLDGLARSTQVGDMAGFFICLGGFALFGAYRENPAFLRAAGILVGMSSITRTIAWAAHDTDFATQFIAIEVICGAVLLFSASRVGQSDAI